MENYIKQGEDFLKKTGAKIDVRFHDMKAGHFGKDDKEVRDIWEIKISRSSREFIFFFGDSVANTEERLDNILKFSPARKCGNRLRKEGVDGLSCFFTYSFSLFRLKSAIKAAEEEAKEWKPAGTGDRPSAYSILGCLTKYEPADNVDDFAAEFGYEKPSEALRVYEAVKKEYSSLCALFNSEEMSEMAEIC